MTVSIQFGLVALTFKSVEGFTLLAFGVFVFGLALVKGLKNELHSINAMATHKKSRKYMYEKLSAFVQTHANTKQLSGQLIL